MFLAVTKPVQFSDFYILLNAVKGGDESSLGKFEEMLEEFQEATKSESPLEDLGQMFLYIGVMELYVYAGTNDLKVIGDMTQSDWEDLKNKQKAELPPHLANTMIAYAKKNRLSKKISQKWQTSKREIDQNIMGMARYVTEGIIDAID